MTVLCAPAGVNEAPSDQSEPKLGWQLNALLLTWAGLRLLGLICPSWQSEDKSALGPFSQPRLSGNVSAYRSTLHLLNCSLTRSHILYEMCLMLWFQTDLKGWTCWYFPCWPAPAGERDFTWGGASGPLAWLSVNVLKCLIHFFKPCSV